jgi:hypothetical protein
MDDVTPLRQLAGARTTTAAAGVRGTPVVGAASGRAAGAGVTAPLGGQAAMDLSKPVLLQPAARIRYRAAAGGGRRGGSGPEYPPVALPIDYLLPDGFKGEVTLEIADAKGRVVRTVRPAASGRGGGGGRGEGGGDPDDPDMRGGRGRGGAPAGLTTKPGHNRFMWDYRWANGGPLAAPGTYTAKLTAGETTQSQTFEVKVDPGVVKDGTTVADLVEQQNFLLQLRGTITQGTALRTKLQQAMQQRNVQPATPPAPGESTTQLVEKLKTANNTNVALQSLWARLVTAPGTYQQPMLLDQLNSINRVESGADQKVGMESRKRYDDLVKELKDIEAILAAVTK